MNGIKVVSHTDYITMSYDCVKLPSELGFLDGGILGAIETVKPIGFYDAGFRLRCGGMLWTSENPKQGSRIDLAGKPLQFIRDAGITDAQILMILSNTELKKRTTRIDYCWTIKDAGMVDHTVRHWFAGKKKTTFRKDPTGYVRHGSRAGQTVWYGSEDNPRRVKVYDKGFEMGLLNDALIRVELQLRAEFAQNLVIDAYNSSVKAAARSHLLGILDFPHLAWWTRAIHGDVIETSEVPKRPSKWKQWMGTQVKGSIEQHLGANADGDREFMRMWLREMVEIFNRDEK